jgi:hypothetical protein
VVRLQRFIRKHQQFNVERANLLILVFERGLLPFVNHVRIVASGKSFASKNLTEIEVAAIARMCGKYTDPLKVVVDMKNPSFHKSLLRLFPSEVRAHARHLKFRGEYSGISNYNNNPDFPLLIKRRVCLDYFYRVRRDAIRKMYEDKYRVVIVPVKIEEVREYIHSPRDAVADPLTRNINAMLEFQNSLRKSSNPVEGTVGSTAPNKLHGKPNLKNHIYIKVLTEFSGIAFAEIYFACNDMYIAHLRGLEAENEDVRCGNRNSGAYSFDEDDELPAEVHASEKLEHLRRHVLEKVDEVGDYTTDLPTYVSNAAGSELLPKNIRSDTSSQNNEEDTFITPCLPSSSLTNAPGMAPRKYSVGIHTSKKISGRTAHAPETQKSSKLPFSRLNVSVK